ncbi:hypothetical protein E4U43_006282 [Claviceps pusilla]|uniref:25S rRNA (Uridine(2843)-N(3))-methyltransferase n=1 Tax=Claviceps pusilla TaxID=123648 RepID=A0A9P7NDV0_9HYPO|nr:hypothetical protein E4U43_006282 [Claviceps pusilla]
MVSKTSAPKNKTNPSAKKASKRQHSSSSSQQAAQSSNPSFSAEHHDAVHSSKEQQQVLLNIFSDAFAAVLSSDRFPVLLGEIKQALYERDFGAAFGREEYLETYAARWSPTRALCYASIFLGLHRYVDGVMTGLGHAGELGEATTEGASMSSEQQQQQQQFESDDQDQHQDDGPDEAPAPSTTTSQSRTLRMLCIGGCAAEHVAFASYLQTTNHRGTLTLLDSGPWAHISSLLQRAVTTAPPLSKYASASARASNKALLAPGQLDFAFTQANVLDMADDKLAEMVGPQPQIVTLLFTLNELYTAVGIGKTTAFLRALGGVLPAQSLLLVVDSPGSYSEAAVGKDKKKYPMQWLLHHTLLQSETSSGYAWERLESHDSVWFRLPEGLRYPIQLESMRYQMHLYRIHKDSTG